MFNWLWNAFSRQSVSHVEQSQHDDDPSNTDRHVKEINAQSDTNDPAPFDDTDTNKTPTQDTPTNENSKSRSRYTVKDIQPVLFYCPYQHCSYSASLAATTCQHIRRTHDSNFFVLLSNQDAHAALFTTSTPSDQSISLLDRNTSIEPTVRLIAVDNNDVNGDKKHIHYYCPYQNCSHDTDEQQEITRHIRLKHYPDLPENGKAEHQCYRTVDGKVIVDFSEKYHSVLLPNTVLIPCDASGDVPKQYANAILNDPITASSSKAAPNGNKSAVASTKPKEKATKRRQQAPEPPARRRNPKRRKRNPLEQEEWVLY
ncbi:hypothetical protein BDB00DRAFT_52174 [Zychaea mexicana]|uniref:uncharacterized protein n=1 Tax=Zychaea mexicana TaxID=64656 RepID=UPI0022FEB128|nr:uncharacterized protein BDB00DRAFT_52174 [Zychaea mexicana]KAI9497058.1 hypothetical protein BDB00DRAFT_52174 [Zychaea mexicana]